MKRMFNTTVAAPTMRTDASFGLNGREKVHPISDVANLAVQNFRDIEEAELEAIVEKVTNVAEQELNYERDVENAPTEQDGGASALTGASSKKVPETPRDSKTVKFIRDMIEKRAKRVARSYEFVEQFESTKKEAIIAIVANDPSFLVHATLDELWEAILRRHAWHFSPLIMTAVTGMQVVMAVIPLLSKNADFNISTGLMALFYVVSLAAANSFALCTDLQRMITKPMAKLEKKHGKAAVYGLYALMSPALLLAFTVTTVLDLSMGKVIDLSAGSVANVLVNVLIQATSISIGLRSGNSVGAIQTFVGFDFLSTIDEAVINANVNHHDLTKRRHDFDQRDYAKILIARLVMYVSTFVILAGVAYITYLNECLFFCNY